MIHTEKKAINILKKQQTESIHQKHNKKKNQEVNERMREMRGEKRKKNRT